jgi:hypothetical protein
MKPSLARHLKNCRLAKGHERRNDRHVGRRRRAKQGFCAREEVSGLVLEHPILLVEETDGDYACMNVRGIRSAG